MAREQDPADLIIDRVMPQATPEKRAEAVANLHRLARALLHIRPLLQTLDDVQRPTPRKPQTEVDLESPNLPVL